MTEGLLCDRTGCVRGARLAFKAGTIAVEVCKLHQSWAIARILEASGGRPMAFAIAHIAFRDLVYTAIPVMRGGSS